MNLTKANREKNLKQWRALGPAIIEKPLRRVHAKHPDLKNAQGAFAGHHPIYALALHAAHRGDGKTVKRLARR